MAEARTVHFPPTLATAPSRSHEQPGQLNGASKLAPPTATRVPYTTSLSKYPSCRDCRSARTESSSARINSRDSSMTSGEREIHDIELLVGIDLVCGLIVLAGLVYAVVRIIVQLRGDAKRAARRAGA